MTDIDRTNQMIWKDENDIIYDLDGMTIEQVIEYFQELKKEHAIKGEQVRLDVRLDVQSWDDSTRLYIQTGRLETDAERDLRVARAEEVKKTLLDREREIYERLRAKFEGT